MKVTLPGCAARISLTMDSLAEIWEAEPREISTPLASVQEMLSVLGAE